MEPIRILQVVTIMNRGGLETMLMNYYRQMDRGKVQFDFIVHRPERGHYDDEIECLGGNIYQMPHIRPGNYRLYFKMLNQFFAAHPQYRVVHSHINENSSFVLRAAKHAGVTCRIAHSHLSDLGIDLKFPFRLYARIIMKNYPTKYFACSKNAGHWLFGKSKEITVLNNAVNVQEFQYDQEIRNKVRKELGIGNQLVLGHIGRFNKQKNHDFLIELFQQVNRKRPDSILLLAGDGHLKQSIIKKVNKLGLDANVKFLGLRGDIPRLLQGMDLFIFPSLFEGLPVVLIEAQAAGLKCVISDAITPDADITGNVEFKSLKESPEAWADAILASSHKHEETADVLIRSGYDSLHMAEWLSEFYRNQALEQIL